MTRYPVRALAAPAFCILFSGCSMFGAPAPEPASPPRSSPVREFIVSRVPGTAEATGMVSDPEFGENLRIVLEQEFLSAANKTCRRASLFSSKGDAEMVVMCRDASGNWEMAPRVWGQGLPGTAEGGAASAAARKKDSGPESAQ